MKDKEQQQINKLYFDFLTILDDINSENSYFNIINNTVLKKMNRDSDSAIFFVSLILDIDLKKYENITFYQFSEIFKYIVEALFLNISTLLNYFSGSLESKRLQEYLSL